MQSHSCLAQALVSGSRKVALRFGGPVSDAEIVSPWVEAIPNSTKATTDRGIRVWNEWVASRATTKDKYSYFFVVHALFMHLLSKKIALSVYCTLKCTLSDLKHSF